MDENDIAIGASPSDWILALGSICADLSERLRSLHEAIESGDTTSADIIRGGIRPLERVAFAIQEAVYAEPEAPDGIDLAKRERDILEDHGLPLISVRS